MTGEKTSKLAFMAVLVVVTIAADRLNAEDTKQIGRRYRLNVTSAGLPSLGAALSGYKIRSRYQVFAKAERVGEAYLGDPVYVPAPGAYRIVVNGREQTMNFVIPREMTRARILACWTRQRAVELRPSKLGRRFTVPSIFVSHPAAITGKHNDNYEIFGLKNGKATSKQALARGVAVVYTPEDIKDIDDGVLFSNTLVHLMPGDYQLRINGTQRNFTLKAGESQFLRLAGLAVKGKWPEELSLVQRHSNGRQSKITQPRDKKLFVVVPGKYQIGLQGVVVKEGQAVTLRYDPKKRFGLRRPRLGVRAINDKRGGIRVTGFLLNSPAAKAGLKVGDLIVAIDGQKTKTTGALGLALKQRQYGEKATFEVLRQGRSKALIVEIQLGLKPDPQKPAQNLKEPTKTKNVNNNENVNEVNKNVRAKKPKTNQKKTGKLF